MNYKVFKHDNRLDKNPIKVALESCKVLEDFYKVDKETLLEESPIERRLSSYLLPANASDGTVFTVLSKTIYGAAGFIVKGQQRPTLSFVETQGENHASLDGTKITLSLSPLFDHRVPLELRVDTIIAVGLHEIAHCRFTTPELGKLLLENGYTTNKLQPNGRLLQIPDYNCVSKIFKNTLHQNLLNITEDRRIELHLLKHYGGYVFYFDRERQYVLWEKLNSYELTPEKEITTETIYPLLFEYIMLSVLMPEALDAFLSTITPSTSPVYSLFTNLCRKANEITHNPSLSLAGALHQADLLLDLFPEEEQEQMSKKMCASEQGKPTGGKGTLTEEEIKMLEKLLGEITNQAAVEEREIEIPNQVRKETGVVKIFPTNPGSFNQQTYTDALALSRQISNNLAFVDSRFNRMIEAFEMTQGDLDESELHSLRFNKHVFFEEEEAPGYSLDFAVLVDESGSMSGNKISNARTAALAFALALKDSQFINLTVYGHTADMEGADVLLYRYFDPSNRAKDINTLFSISARGNNADGFAIEEVGNMLKASPSKMKVLVVISDGQPAARCYGGALGKKHVRDVVTDLEKSNIFVIQVALESFNSAEMFTNFVSYEPGKNLGQDLKKILQKKLVEISNLI